MDGEGIYGDEGLWLRKGKGMQKVMEGLENNCNQGDGIGWEKRKMNRNCLLMLFFTFFLTCFSSGFGDAFRVQNLFMQF